MRLAATARHRSRPLAQIERSTQASLTPLARALSSVASMAAVAVERGDRSEAELGRRDGEHARAAAEVDERGQRAALAPPASSSSSRAAAWSGAHRGPEA